MKKFLFAALLLTGCAGTDSLTETTSTENLLPFAELITPDFLRQHLEVIAHDSLEGRGTGERGQKIAAEYIANFYDNLGMQPKGDNGSYFQHFKLNTGLTDSLVYQTYRIEGTDTISVDRSVESGASTGEYVRIFGGSVPLSGSVVFAGFGVEDPEHEVSHLDGTSLEGNWVLIFEDMPAIANGDTLFNPELTNNDRMSRILGPKNADGILVITGYDRQDFDEMARAYSNIMSTPTSMTLDYLDDNDGPSGFPRGIVQVSPEMSAKLLGFDSIDELDSLRETIISEMKEFEAYETSFHLDYHPYDDSAQIETENVIAYHEGADPDLRDEVLVLMAHYDHVGIGHPDETGDIIYNGADDNGSGTVALMNIAYALQNAKHEGYQPKRSVLFLHVTAEEVGLLGSRYYSDHPVIPIEQTVANFNADMIGRSDDRNIEAGDTDYVYLIGGEIISSELDSLVQQANEQSVGMRLDRFYNDLQDPNQFYRRSDHWNFGRLEVPFVFFFTGVHEDYHQPSDTVDKMEFEKFSRVVRLIYSSTLEVTNYDGRPEVDNEEFIEITRSMAR